jgi:CBS domain containing-hemolysin-like protein
VTLDALLWLSIASALASCLVAVGARTLREYSRHDLEELCERTGKQELFRNILRDDDRVALGVQMFLVLGATVTVAAGALAVMMWLELTAAAPPLTFAATVLGMALPLMLLLVCLPWSVSRIGAANFLYHTWPLWRALNVLALPLVWCARLVDAVIHRLAGRNYQAQDEESFEEEIRTIVSEGQREGLLEEEAREMIEGIMDLGDAEVSQIMTPRTDMHMVQVNMPWDELLADVIRFGHTRVPVYDKNRDDIIGILYSKDLLPELAKDSKNRRPVAELLRKPLFVPETKPVDDLLEMFQQMRTHIAIVLDEYGGVSGLVTIEDALEEIVGEIVDEYDREVEDDIKQLENGTVEALGRAHVDEINEAMGTELPEDEDYDTIGGFVFSELGRVPLAGEELVWRDAVHVTILEASRRRINRVRIQRLDEESREIA